MKKLAYIIPVLLVVGLFVAAEASANGPGFFGRPSIEERAGDHLDSLVEEGEITEEQRQTLVEKKQEMWEAREQLRDLSPEERKEEMSQLREEFRAWAEENGLDCPVGSGSRGMRKGNRARD